MCFDRDGLASMTEMLGRLSVRLPSLERRWYLPGALRGEVVSEAEMEGMEYSMRVAGVALVVVVD